MSTIKNISHYSGYFNQSFIHFMELLDPQLTLSASDPKHLSYKSLTKTRRPIYLNIHKYS